MPHFGLTDPDKPGEEEAVLMRLGVMPFDESALPPEDPSTF